MNFGIGRYVGHCDVHNANVFELRSARMISRYVCHTISIKTFNYSAFLFRPVRSLPVSDSSLRVLVRLLVKVRMLVGILVRVLVRVLVRNSLGWRAMRNRKEEHVRCVTSCFNDFRETDTLHDFLSLNKK